MPYRRTENVVRRLAEREQAIVIAASSLAAEGGMAAVQIASVAARAGIAAGTVYRYFPSKTDLIAELIAAIAGRELAAMRAAAEGAPGPLSALAATIATFAARALNERRSHPGRRSASRSTPRSMPCASISANRLPPNLNSASRPRSMAATCRSRMRASPRRQSSARSWAG